MSDSPVVLVGVCGKQTIMDGKSELSQRPCNGFGETSLVANLAIKLVIRHDN